MVNVNDIPDHIVPEVSLGKDRLSLIYDRQNELMIKYHVIEHNNGLLQVEGATALDLHDRHCQARLKDLAWRVTEELAEAHEAYVMGDPTNHFVEELSDAFHFLLELNIQSGITSHDIYDFIVPDYKQTDSHCRLEAVFNHIPLGDGDIDTQMMSVIAPLGLAMNCLKNKPWKQTHLLTDITKYRHIIKHANKLFFSLTIRAGLSADQLFRIYFKKSEVNKFRQRSKY